jgi:hypothetical protein
MVNGMLQWARVIAVVAERSVLLLRIQRCRDIRQDTGLPGSAPVAVPLRQAVGVVLPGGRSS